MSETPGSPPEISEEIKRTWSKTRLDISAGGVAYRVDAGSGETEIALISTRNGTRWQLPKGSREAGETARATAIREVEEEVGLITEIECFLQRIDFWYWDTFRKTVPELVHKQVDFFLLQIVGGELSDISHEVDAVSWFTTKQALEVLSYEGERDVVKRTISVLDRTDQRQEPE